MKKFRFCILILLLLALILPAAAQDKPNLPPPGSDEDPTKDIKIDETKYDPAGIMIGQSALKAGERLEVLWGIMGPPDQIWAMRGKDDVNEDYVKLDYYSYGISFDVHSLKNLVDGILIEENNRAIRLFNCPFRIGQQEKEVIDAWGEPERRFPGNLAYWRRGVYIGIDDSGAISHLYITRTGVFDHEKEGKDGKKDDKKDEKGKSK